MLLPFTETQRNQMTSTRAGEVKAGETVQLWDTEKNLEKCSSRFVLLGLKEDIGIRANLGRAGAAEAWDYAVPALLNNQDNRFFRGEDLCIAGALSFDELVEKAASLNPSHPEDLQQLRDLTEQVDGLVASMVRLIAEAGKIPILLGGGHNNAFGNLKGCSEALGQRLSVLNIDPHTDYRATEGRHSGNGFRYARERGFLNRYAVYGLHESYNSEKILRTFDEDKDLSYLTFESLLPLAEDERDRHFRNMLQWVGTDPMGLEVDLDALTAFPVSALNPSGFTLNEVRSMVRVAASLKAPCYFHLCEGSPGQASGTKEKELLGKSIAYLITDFIKAYGA